MTDRNGQELIPYQKVQYKYLQKWREGVLLSSSKGRTGIVRILIKREGRVDTVRKQEYVVSI